MFETSTNPNAAAGGTIKLRAGDASIRWGCFLMAPWPGRLADGRFTWRGRTVQLPRTHGRHAIHGVGWDRRWGVVSASATWATLELDLAEAGWPMGGVVRETLELAPDRLTLTAEVIARDATPVALGWHPWFLRRGGARLRLDAEAVLETTGMLPTGRHLPLAGKLDLRGGPDLGDRRLDQVYVGVRSPAVVTWPDLELRIELGPDQNVAVVYTPRDVFCVEPMTAISNAPNDPGVATLEAGERHTSTTMLAWRDRTATPG